MAINETILKEINLIKELNSSLSSDLDSLKPKMLNIINADQLELEEGNKILGSPICWLEMDKVASDSELQRVGLEIDRSRLKAPNPPAKKEQPEQVIANTD